MRALFKLRETSVGEVINVLDSRAIASNKNPTNKGVGKLEFLDTSNNTYDSRD